MDEFNEEVESWLNSLKGLWPPEQIGLLREGFKQLKARAELPDEDREDDPLLTHPEVFLLLCVLRSGVEETEPGLFDLMALRDDRLRAKLAALDRLPFPCRASEVFRAFYQLAFSLLRLRHGLEFELDLGDPWPRALLVKSQRWFPYSRTTIRPQKQSWTKISPSFRPLAPQRRPSSRPPVKPSRMRSRRHRMRRLPRDLIQFLPFFCLDTYQRPMEL
jgi:hypothetical protein